MCVIFVGIHAGNKLILDLNASSVKCNTQALFFPLCSSSSRLSRDCRGVDSSLKTCNRQQQMPSPRVSLPGDQGHADAIYTALQMNGHFLSSCNATTFGSSVLLQ